MTDLMVQVERPASHPPFRRWRARPEVSGLMLDLGAAAFLLAAYNRKFWDLAAGIFDGRPWQLVVFGAAIYALTLFIVLSLGFRWLKRPFIAALLVISAVASYYQDSLGVVIDREMIQNAMLTTVNESRHLITWRFLYTVGVWGVLPAVAVLWLRVRPRPFWRDLLLWPAMLLVSFALLAGLLFSDYKAISAIFREQRAMMASYQPGATLGATLRYGKMVLRGRNVVVAPLGLDARKGPLLSAATKPVLTVVFAGETVRAQNWGLNGYARDTTPGLRARGVINYADVTACGTSTAVSLPCMFSVYPKAEYTHQKHLATENLLDVLARAGISVGWWDNNTGSQGIGARTGQRMMTATLDPAACISGECTDAVFLAPIRKALATMTEDTVLVLHMIGNHGPAYYLRYPPADEVFSPACNTSEFADCTPQEIVNAYDNAVLFTDRILSQTIDLLAAQDRVVPAMLYVSDHGESLGEDGLYLHAAPGFMAPDVQTKVPMVMWLSDAFETVMKLDSACLAARAAQPVSHDQVFHSVLGLMDVTTAVRDPALDLTAACRAPA
ncbi:MAG: sulfatase-like hydrolase/transferase [Pseudomonadota bacterium]